MARQLTKSHAAVPEAPAKQRLRAVAGYFAGPEAGDNDRLIYERGGWYYTSRELEWDRVPNESALPV